MVSSQTEGRVYSPTLRVDQIDQVMTQKWFVQQSYPKVHSRVKTIESNPAVTALAELSESTLS